MTDHKRFWCACAALFAMWSADARADWTGRGEAGFVMARGNSDSDTANAKLELSAERNKWKQAFGLALLYGESNEVATAERWHARWQSDYRLNHRLFAFGATRYEQDRFSGFEYQASLSSGLGYHFIDTADTKFTGTLGAGFRILRTETLTKDTSGAVIQRIPGQREDDPVGRVGLDFTHALTENTQLTNKLVAESGSENTFAHNELALQVSMSEKLALSVGYAVRHNTEPPENLQKTDQLTTLNLVYKIK